MCPLCKSPYYKLIGLPKLNQKSKKIIKQNYTIVQCNDCQYYFVEPELKLSDSEWQYLYDDEYFGDYTSWHNEKRKKDRKKRLKKLTEYSENKVKTFLDIGCGEGLMLREALNNDLKVYGLDISDNRMEEAKTNKISFVQNDLLSANLPANFFDCIYMDSILEHVTNPRGYIFEVYRILKKGGVLYIGVPNEDSLLNTFISIQNLITGNRKYSSKIKPFITPYHVGGFNKRSLKYLLEGEGFYISEFRNFATKLVFLMSRFPSKEFIYNLALTFIHIMAFVIKKEYYLEVYAKK